MKKAIKAAAFIIIAAAIFFGLDRLLVRKSLYGWWNMTTKINGFFNSDNDRYDVVFCGSSHAYCSFNPLVIWEETGLDSYVIATQKQPFWASYYYIKEAISRQHPQLIVLDCYTASKEEEYTDDATNYTLCDDFPFGINKLKMIYDCAPPGKRFDLLVRFTKYHSRWSELGEEDFGFRPDKLCDWLNGYCMLTQTKADVQKPYIGDKDLSIPLSEKNTEYLKRIIALCREENASLLIVKTPSNETASEHAYYNFVAAIAEENDISFINYNDLYRQIGIDMNRDFFDSAHLNHRGAEKFSKYFAEHELKSMSPRAASDYTLQLARYRREYSGDYNPFVLKPEFLHRADG